MAKRNRTRNRGLEGSQPATRSDTRRSTSHSGPSKAPGKKKAAGVEATRPTMKRRACAEKCYRTADLYGWTGSKCQSCLETEKLRRNRVA